MDNPDILLEVEKVTAGYNGEVIIDGTSFNVYEKDFIGIIGPNGGGKTTLVKIILGLLRPYSGQIKYHFGKTSGEQLIGYLPQVHIVDKKFPISVRDVVLSGLMTKDRLIKRFTSEEKKKAEMQMEMMGILEIRKKAIGELSGGQLQRTFLCRALISSPKLLILDEPNNNVDNKFESDLYKVLHELNKTIAIMMVSHDIGIISTHIKTIICVNRHVHYHPSNIINEDQLRSYNCPIQLITHGEVPHTVLKTHLHEP
ncbi:MAG: ATP-binding cassette domain-containing protein [Bacteroidetes bacterium]|nr:ATP-binding cassette domain-containing protein [Bacteroidota bacterium]